ncbi:MAG: carbonic anhydrase family protein [Polyangiales bacterium]
MRRSCTFIDLLAIAILLFMHTGCATKPCAPCEATVASPRLADAKGGASASGSYYALPGIEHGPLQSPVNILSDAVEGGKHTIEYGHGDGAQQVDNLGHTVQLGFGRGIKTELDGKSYELMQVHFHTPSEHLIDGITYPMEMHIVHSRAGLLASDPPDYLVIALLFRMGGPNRFIEEFLGAIPTQEGQSAKVEDVFIVDVLSPDVDVASIDYYHYRGSLTTPPYTESVNWLVAKEIMQAGPAQIQRINLLEGDNARHVQPLYRREIDD